MLDHFTNQASGLIGLGCQPGPRLVAMVSHGDDQAELPLLWQICLSLVSFGYSVTVLDATTAESEINPGLQQMLESDLWADEDKRDSPAWTVLPSAKAIRSLSEMPGSGAHKLCQLRPTLPAEGIVVLYCQVEPMLALVGDYCYLEPVLAVSPAQAYLLTGYIALKRLLITGKLKPTIVNMLLKHSPHAAAPPLSAFAGLAECAKRFLGHELRTLDVTEERGETQPCATVDGLALRLLEGAVVLGEQEAPKAGMPRAACKGLFAQFAGSH
jgi:hypothetical protein